MIEKSENWEMIGKVIQDISTKNVLREAISENIVNKCGGMRSYTSWYCDKWNNHMRKQSVQEFLCLLYVVRSWASSN